MAPVSPGRQDVDEVDGKVDVLPGHRPEEIEQDERVEERSDAPRQAVTNGGDPAARAPDRDRVERADVNPGSVEHGRG